ncbi:hypothetical protein V8G54_017539 [Vigna mungo]|uniref:Uncharacterized protein n=1 Tax=Vigna mungo TaxID=3915 RepID=A0AAQ3S296_VIGMU
MCWAALHIYHFTFTTIFFNSLLCLENLNRARGSASAYHAPALSPIRYSPFASCISVSHAHIFFPLLFSPIFSSYVSLNRLGPVQQLLTGNMLIVLYCYASCHATNGKMAGNSNTREGKTIMVPKTEDLDYELPSYTTFSGNVGEANGASSSGGKLRAFFIGMGFLPCVVDKVIEENGISCEENSETLLEALLRCSAHKSNCDSSDSLSGFHNTSSGTRAPNIYHDGHSKEASGVIIWDGKWLLLDPFDDLLLDHLLMSIPASFMLERSDSSVRSDMTNEEALQKSNSLSSDSLDSLFDDKDLPEVSNVNEAKEGLDKASFQWFHSSSRWYTRAPSYLTENINPSLANQDSVKITCAFAIGWARNKFQRALTKPHLLGCSRSRILIILAWHLFVASYALSKVVVIGSLLLLQEIDELNREIDDKRGSLLMMNFSIEEVEFAIRKLGFRNQELSQSVEGDHDQAPKQPRKKVWTSGEPLESRGGAVRPRGVGRSNPLWKEYGIMGFLIVLFHIGGEASIPELVDFIFALQIAKKLKKEPEDITYESDEVKIYLMRFFRR